MSDEKETIKIDELDLPSGDEAGTEPDVVVELRNLGRQVGDTLRAAWQSEERHRFEAEIREGMRSFVSEIDKALIEIRETDAAQKVREEAGELKSRVGSAELTHKAAETVAKGLRMFSEGLSSLAEQFTAREKSPEKQTPDEPAD